MAKKMFKREYFMAIVGFYGNAALVDKKLSAQVKKLSAAQLLEKGLLFPAICGAFHDEVSGQKNSGKNAEASKKLLCEYFKTDNFSSLVRRYGVHEPVLTEGGYRIRFI